MKRVSLSVWAARIWLAVVILAWLVLALRVALEGRIHNRFRESCIERGEVCSAVLRRAIYEYCGEVEPVKVRDEENAHAD